MILFTKMITNVKEFDDKYRDRRSEDYFLLGSPFQVFLIVVLYYAFVKYIGPKIMENRRPFKLKWIMLAYNSFQVLFNAYIGGIGLYHIFADNPYENYGCMMPIMDNSRPARIELRYSYLYMLLKFVDYLDTVFFVLRKRYNQVTFLHVYHHIMISVGTFFYLRYLPGGHSCLLGILNCLVHAFMYSYYFLSALRPELRQAMWWKKYITQFQIVQFIVLFGHFMRPLLRKDCQYPKVAVLFALAQCVMMSALFINFYIKAYIKKPKLCAEKEAQLLAQRANVFAQQQSDEKKYQCENIEQQNNNFISNKKEN